MSEPKSKPESFLDHLRAFFTPQTDSTPPVIPPALSQRSGDPEPAEGSESAGRIEGSAFSERLQQLEQRLDTLAAEKENADKKLTEAESDRRRQQVATFVESLRRAGRFPPAFERWGVVEFMERLARVDEPAPVAQTEQPAVEPQPTLVAWFHDFLTRLPAVIEFAELGSPGAATRHSLGEGGRLVRFTEPQRGMSVDPASIELAERAEALAAELGITYAEALRQLREEHRSTATIA